eukprot:TRINITY_DN190360_c0_g3_i1.p1 TRINITY_DN190360_c0_g3~~TRINITY_DN190360_c0_g3_i1.p1  ORF type:complete len:421 (+),score=156.85 TRINITY_DN190360_c0_g3_i1:357-1619(+)
MINCLFLCFHSSAKGVWRQVLIRESVRTKDILVAITVKLEDVNEEIYNKELSEITEILKNAKLMNDSKITSFGIQRFDGMSTPDPNEHPVEMVFGKPSLHEKMCGRNFEVNPLAFFQVNTEAAEQLYEKVADVAKLEKDSVVLDICCGTGSIGLSLADKVKKVVGVEMCAPAVIDARRNALNNGVDNTYFICGKAEDVLLKAWKKDDISTLSAEDQIAMTELQKALLDNPIDGSATANTSQQEEENMDITTEAKEEVTGNEFHPGNVSSKIIGIVDPPRAGLHHSVISTLRKCKHLKRLVYVSCDPTGSFVSDYAMLCQAPSTSIKGTSFRPVFSAPVDLFPHTPHCELVTVFVKDELCAIRKAGGNEEKKILEYSKKVEEKVGAPVQIDDNEAMMAEEEEPIVEKSEKKGERRRSCQIM